MNAQSRSPNRQLVLLKTDWQPSRLLKKARSMKAVMIKAVNFAAWH
jgi:hypothetical protein